MHREHGRDVLSALSALGAWLVPAWGCPVCLSAFAATMSALGLGFVGTKAVLTRLTGLLLGVALVSIGFGARRRRVYGPLSLSVAAAGLLVAAKFWPGEPWVGYAGLAALLTACIWSARTAVARASDPPIAASPRDESTGGKDGNEEESRGLQCRLSGM